MNSHELIESYVHEVGQHLPRRLRADIELELRSLLADGLEDRIDDEAAVVEFLKQLGSPMQFASQYLSNQYLIGSNWFPIFKLVSTIVFIVITVLTAVAIGYTISQHGLPDNALSWWFSEMTEYVRNLIYAFGLMTLVFAFLERVGVNDLTAQDVWDPKTLRPVKDPSRINRPELIAAIAASLIGIWVLSELPNWIGTNDGGFFTNGYLAHIPWLVTGMVIEIIMRLMVLKDGRWHKSTRLLEIGTQFFDAYVLYRIINGPLLISVEAIDILVKRALGIALVVIIIVTVVKLYKLLVSPPEHPMQARSKTA